MGDEERVAAVHECWMGRAKANEREKQTFVTFMSQSGKCLISVDKSSANWDRLTLSLDNKIHFFSRFVSAVPCAQPLPIFNVGSLPFNQISRCFQSRRFFLPLHFCHSVFCVSFIRSRVNWTVCSVSAYVELLRSVQRLSSSRTFVCHVKFYYTQNSVMYASNSHEMHRLCNHCHYSLNGEFVRSTMLHNERVLALPLMLYHIMCWIIHGPHRETERGNRKKVAMGKMCSHQHFLLFHYDYGRNGFPLIDCVVYGRGFATGFALKCNCVVVKAARQQRIVCFDFNIEGP